MLKFLLKNLGQNKLDPRSLIKWQKGIIEKTLIIPWCVAESDNVKEFHKHKNCQSLWSGFYKRKVSQMEKIKANNFLVQFIKWLPCLIFDIMIFFPNLM